MPAQVKFLWWLREAIAKSPKVELRVKRINTKRQREEKVRQANENRCSASS